MPSTDRSPSFKTATLYIEYTKYNKNNNEYDTYTYSLPIMCVTRKSHFQYTGTNNIDAQVSFNNTQEITGPKTDFSEAGSHYAPFLGEATDWQNNRNQ